MSDELKVGDRITHPEYGAGIVLQPPWQGKVVVQLEEGGIVTVGLRSLTRQTRSARWTS